MDLLGPLVSVYRNRVFQNIRALTPFKNLTMCKNSLPNHYSVSVPTDIPTANCDTSDHSICTQSPESLSPTVLYNPLGVTAWVLCQSHAMCLPQQEVQRFVIMNNLLIQVDCLTI